MKHSPAATVGGVSVHTPTKSEFLSRLRAHFNSSDIALARKTWSVFTLNPEILMRASADASYASVLRSGTWNVVDGIGLALALRANRVHTPERLCGSDLIYDFAALAEEVGRPLLLLGGTNERLARARAVLMSRYEGLRVLCISPAFTNRLPLEEQDEIMRMIEKERPAVVAVCLGAPKQELWIHENQEFLGKCGVSVAAGLGGTVDFVSGDVSRAPQIVRAMGFEWLYRLCREPKRLKRQITTLPAFVWRSLLDRSFVKHVASESKCVLYAHYAPPHPSASATRLLSLARYLRRNGVQVEILSSNPGPEEFDGFRIVRARTRIQLLKFLCRRDVRSSIFVTSPPATPAAEVAALARLLGYRVIVDIRDPFVAEALATGDLRPGLRTSVKRFLEASLFRSAHAVSFVSTELRDRMVELVGEINRPCHIAPNGVDCGIFYLDSAARDGTRESLGFGSEPTFVYAGILGGKSLDEAIPALVPALKRGAKLLIIGVVDQHSAKMQENLRTLAQQHQVEDQVVWKENLPLEDVAKLLNACDVGINPLPTARAYCLPVKTYEYMACGLYNLAYGASHGALSQLLADPICGRLCTDWNEFSKAALAICDQVNNIRSEAGYRASCAQKFDRSASNARLHTALSGNFG